jgi:hypothetical protein
VHTLAQGWQQWASTASQQESGWESEFPGWGELMEAAKAVMLGPSPTGQELMDVALCWAISEESELLADFAKEHIEECLPVVEFIATAPSPRARWQALEALGFAGERGSKLLRKGLQDEDPYCRRRALLSLSRLRPHDARAIAEHYSHDPDPYMRQAAIDMAVATADAVFLRRMKAVLLRDAAWHVRKAAEAIATGPPSST